MKTLLKTSALVVFAASLGLVVIGCGSDKSGPVSPLAGSQLYASDQAAFAQIDLGQTQASAPDLASLFAQIFGGTDAGSVINFYQARIQYAFTQADFANATSSPSSFPNEGWLKMPGDSNGGGEQSQPASDPSIQVGALNQSTLLWLEGVVNHTPVTLTIAGTSIPLTSTRVGVIELGDGYVATEKASDGTPITVPVAYRQAVLVHEARHSDCTDGLSANELMLMQQSKTHDDFVANIPLPHCGHTHVICTSGTYKDIPACDVERYGAYTVGAVYSAALSYSQPDELSTKIMQVTAIDYDSRYVGAPIDSPDEHKPNMTSEGLTP